MSHSTKLRVLRLSLALGALWLLFGAGAGVFLAEGSLRPQRRRVNAGGEQRAEALAARVGARVQSVTLGAADSAVLRAWYFGAGPSPQNQGHAVILLHGVSDSRLGVVPFAEMLLAHGYSVLVPDARAHGESGGDLATYGLLERDDLRVWAKWLAAKQQESSLANESSGQCVYALGESMGGAILLQSLPSASKRRREEGDFCAVITESSFASFREVAYDRLGQPFGLSHWAGRTIFRPIVTAGILYARIRYGIDLEQASPEEAITHAEVPVLLIHGTADDNIPPRHGRLLRQARATASLWEVPGASHTSASSKEPEEFNRRVLTWFAGHARTGNGAPAAAH